MNKVEELVKEDSQTVTCSACGATYPITNRYCPFCGSVNELGDELEFQNKLEDIREDLEDLEDASEEAIKDEAQSSIRMVGKFVINAAVLVGIIAIITIILTFYRKRINEKRETKELFWSQNEYEKLDELYEKDDMEALRDYYYDFYTYEYDANHSIAGWDHGLIVTAFMDYSDILRTLELVEKYPENAEDQKAELFAETAKLLETDYEASDYNNKLNDKDRDKIAAYKKKAEEILKEYYHLTPDDLKDMYEDLYVTDSMNPYFDMTKAFAKGEKVTWYK